jgi:hypothetical protein
MLGLLALFALLVLLTGSAQAQLRGLDDGSSLRSPISPWPIQDDDDDDGDDNGLGFGKNFAGSWLGSGSFDVDLGCDGVFEFFGVPVLDAHTFGIAGGHVATNPNNPNSGHGTWEKTGQREITVRDLNFGVDSTPNGTLINKAIVTMVVQFDEDFETATTLFGAVVYDPAEDPLDPAGSPMVCTQGQHTSFRKVDPTP